MTTRILLIRHGQTTWNVENRFRGQVDVPLDETGRWQARVTADYVAARWPLKAVYTSPLGRAVQTAEPIAEAQGVQVHLLDGLMDISFGEWAGKPLSEVEHIWPERFETWFAAPHTVRFPGGEELADVLERVTGALEEVTRRHEGETLALVAHTVVNRVLLCAVLGVGNEHFWQLAQDTCAVNGITWDGKGYFLEWMNDTSGLWHAKRERKT
jgi:broad specificity phosphatase PhoE